jgi:hypothetical protein
MEQENSLPHSRPSIQNLVIEIAETEMRTIQILQEYKKSAFSDKRLAAESIEFSRQQIRFLKELHKYF